MDLPTRTASATPGRVRALVLTDIVDSTAVAARLGDVAAAELWRAHDRAARDLIRGARGREIDKSDGLLVLFDSADDALAFAAAYHRALAALPTPLSARAGIHVGAVMLHENSPEDVARGAKPVEVDGVAKPIVARIAAIARGAQTLLSADARAALADGGHALRTQGHWRVKGVAEPIELFAPADTGAAAAVPPEDGDKAWRVVRQGDLWLPVRAIRHRIPAEPDAFVGRADPLLDLTRLIGAGARLVSVRGIGGCGKTRLATRFAWTNLGEFPGGAWFCDLSSARDVNGIARAVADALEVPLGSDDAVAHLGHAIAAHGRCLLILDNFEQVAAHARATVGSWLGRAREACFVVTTREVLGLPGEHALVVPPLPPDDAVALFVRRAEASRPGFSATSDDAAAIARLVALLDGLPLAIELAAARVRMMPPQTILARMNERFRLLASAGARDDRQATLRAAFDWSWDLLSAADRAALAQLSVFEGGFTLDAAEAVLDLSAGTDAPWPADALQSLVDKSWLRNGADGRFELLVSVKEYAAGHLAAPGSFPGSGEAALRATQARHASHYAGLGEERAVEQGCAELDNLVAAGRRAVALGPVDAVPGALEGAAAALKLRGPVGTGVELATLALSCPGLDAAALARVQRVAGDSLRLAGDVVRARTLLEAALAAARAGADRVFEAKARLDLGQLDEGEGRLDAAREQYAAAHALAASNGAAHLAATARNALGTMFEAQGRMDEARAHLDAALATARVGGARGLEARILANLGVLHLEQGRIEEARRAYEAALATARAVGDRRLEGNMLTNLGVVLGQLEGRLPEAHALLVQALALARDMGRPRLEALALCNLGIVDELLGRLDDAQTRLEAAVAIARSLKDQRSEGQFLPYLALVLARRGRIDDAREGLAAGRQLLEAMSDRHSLGILQCSRAETEHLAGAPDAAAAALREAEALAAAVGAGPRSELGVAIARVRGLLGAGR